MCRAAKRRSIKITGFFLLSHRVPQGRQSAEESFGCWHKPGKVRSEPLSGQKGQSQPMLQLSWAGSAAPGLLYLALPGSTSRLGGKRVPKSYLGPTAMVMIIIMILIIILSSWSPGKGELPLE